MTIRRFLSCPGAIMSVDYSAHAFQEFDRYGRRRDTPIPLARWRAGEVGGRHDSHFRAGLVHGWWRFRRDQGLLVRIRPGALCLPAPRTPRAIAPFNATYSIAGALHG